MDVNCHTCHTLLFFNGNKAFYAYFDQYRYFEAITFQLKAFEKQSKRNK